MATLILTTVGGLLGGKVSRAIGGVIGLAVDRTLLAPKGRQGPQLGDLAFQSSTYGALIPKLYGVNRVAGTVIWAMNLREDRQKVSNGKGQPKSTVFSYSASFAVALSARRVLRVARIWADGKLLRGAAGDFKTQTGFRLHSGGEGQTVDPLIASAEGISATPAYHGLAYAVFENLQLADFGNRIPSLSFEVIADEGAVALGAIIEDLADTAVIADCPSVLNGFAAYGDSVRGVIETLASGVAVSADDDGARLRIFEHGTSADLVVDNDLGAVWGNDSAPQLAIERSSASTIPETLSLTYYEPSRDYQESVQRARRDGGARRGAKLSLPIVLTPEMAKQIVETQLNRLWAARVSAKLRVPWRRLDLKPGQIVRIAGNPATWRVARVTLDRMVIEADLVRLSEVRAVATPADPGRGLGSVDLIHGPTTFHPIDLPPLEDGVAASANLVVGAAGISPGWRSAALLISLDNGASWLEAGPTAAPAIIGSTLTVLNAGSARLIDEANNVEVQLLNNAMTLSNTNAAGLDAQRNLAMLGDELIQFRSALPLGANRYRLSGLYRGRRGTEWAMATHSAGERFVLIERETLARISVPASAMAVRMMAVGIGDGAVPPERTLTSLGQAILPIAPVHLCRQILPGGDTQINWVRRSRDGWRWSDFVDVPLVEERERYRIEIVAAGAVVRSIESSSPALLYSAAMRVADSAGGANALLLSVRQIGISGVSRAAKLSL